MFNDEVPLFDRSSENLLQHNVRVDCCDVFPLWALIDVLGCMKTLNANDAVPCVDVNESHCIRADLSHGLGSLAFNSLMMSHNPMIITK